MITRIPNVVPFAPRECVGPVQARLLDRVADSSRHLVFPADLERRAARRLEARGLLGPALGFPGAMTITPYASNCNWLVNR